MFETLDQVNLSRAPQQLAALIQEDVHSMQSKLLSYFPNLLELGFKLFRNSRSILLLLKIEL